MTGSKFEKGQPLQGGGGGTGAVSNVTFKDLTVHNATNAIYINKCYYEIAEEAIFCDISTLEFGDLHFQNIRGFVNRDAGIALNCRAAMPCRDIKIHDAHLRSAKYDNAKIGCDNVMNLKVYTCNATLSE